MGTSPWHPSFLSLSNGFKLHLGEGPLPLTWPSWPGPRLCLYLHPYCTLYSPPCPCSSSHDLSLVFVLFIYSAQTCLGCFLFLDALPSFFSLLQTLAQGSLPQGGPKSPCGGSHGFLSLVAWQRLTVDPVPGSPTRLEAQQEQDCICFY